jgi:hypothetical protein
MIISAVLITTFVVCFLFVIGAIVRDNYRTRRAHRREVLDWHIQTKVWDALVAAGVKPKNVPPMPPNGLSLCGCEYCTGKPRNPSREFWQ